MEQPSEASQPTAVAGSSFRPFVNGSEQFGQDTPSNGAPFGGSQQPSVLQDLHNTLRTESDVQHIDRGIIIANSSNCIIRCLVPCPKLTINEVQTSAIVSGPINGAALVTGMTASTLIISCRQLRLHRCRDCTLYLRCSSRPIIEECSGMQFAPLPEDLVSHRTFRFPEWPLVSNLLGLRTFHRQLARRRIIGTKLLTSIGSRQRIARIGVHSNHKTE